MIENLKTLKVREDYSGLSSNTSLTFVEHPFLIRCRKEDYIWIRKVRWRDFFQDFLGL